MTRVEPVIGELWWRDADIPAGNYKQRLAWALNSDSGIPLVCQIRSSPDTVAAGEVWYSYMYAEASRGCVYRTPLDLFTTIWSKAE